MTFDPSKRGSDMAAMVPYWETVKAVLGGLDAVQAKAKTFLPQLPDEAEKRYEFRQTCMRMTNVFADVVDNLAERPFSNLVTLADDADQEMIDLAEDIDGQGNNMHAFAAQAFHEAVAYTLSWVLVDAPVVEAEGRKMTKAEQEELGIRPVWVRYSPFDVLAAYKARIGGRDQFTHVRLWEPKTEIVDGAEVSYDEIRVLNRERLDKDVYGHPTWQVFRKVQDANGKDEWAPQGDPKPLALPEIPLVPIITGRKGANFNIQPPLRHALDLQKALIKKETGKEFLETLLAYPMLAGQGVTPDLDPKGNPRPVMVGPGLALYAPPQGDGGSPKWEIIEPSGTSVKQLADDIEVIKREIRELGRQPLSTQGGTITRIAAAQAAAKANSAVGAWALDTKDQLELLWVYTAMFLGKTAEEAASVLMNTDFSLDTLEDDGFAHVLSLRKEKEISRKQVLHEAKRRRLLDPDYDPEEDAAALLDEIEGDDDEDEDGDMTGEESPPKPSPKEGETAPDGAPTETQDSET